MTKNPNAFQAGLDAYYRAGCGMKPSEQCKQAGLKSLREMGELSSICEQTLINWHKNKPVAFDCMLAGAVALKALKSK